MERLYDFEEECAEGLMQNKEDESTKKTDVRVKSVLDMMEDVRSKMEDLERWENMTQESNHTVEFKLQKLEEIAQHTASQLSVIHRFMASQNPSESNVGNASEISDRESVIDSQTEDLHVHNDLEPIASCDSREDIGPQGPNISPKEDIRIQQPRHVTSEELNLPTHSLPQTIIPYPFKEWIKDAKDLAISSASNVPNSSVKKDEACGQEAVEGDRVRFQIDKHGVDEENTKCQDVTHPCPNISLSLLDNLDSIDTENIKPLSFKTTEKPKRKISQASSSKPDLFPKSIHREKTGYGSIEKKRHISAESRDSVEVKGGKIMAGEEKLFQRRPRRLTESSAGARTSEEDSNLLSQQSARRRASRMEYAMTGKILARKRRSNDMHDMSKDFHSSKRFSASKESQDEDFKEPLSSGRNYYRSQSENVTGLPSCLSVHNPGDNTTSQSEDDLSDSSESTKGGAKNRLSIFPMNRKIHSRKQRRDYTSITDQLEEMICATPNARSESKSPRPDIPAIEIEAKCLHDAEETDYNLMETLIQQRLRRDSHNLAASLEDLVTKSIRDDSSSNSITSSTCSPADSDTDSNSSKRNLDFDQAGDGEGEISVKDVGTRPKPRKSSIPFQRAPALVSKNVASIVTPAMKCKPKVRNKSAKKRKKNRSKASLASLEIVEEQPKNASAADRSDEIDDSEIKQIGTS